MRFAKKHTRPEEDAANNVKAMSARAEATKAPVQPRVAKPKMPKGPAANSAVLLSSLTPGLGRGLEATWPSVVGSANQSPRFKPRQRPLLQLRPGLQLQLRLPKAPRPL